MEHTRLQPIKGTSGREKTAFTMKTIKELLAEEGTSAQEVLSDAAETPDTAPEKTAAAADPAPAPENAATEKAAPKEEAPKAASLPPIAPAASAAEEASDEKPRSFLGRLIGS